ncbi:Sterol 3-beta-glucosyltransferase [Hondaea fermentalgiana]|uniref:Sterol 3-beta-glucosyltransferase n=1 Tax=Hondaea fermentalgiana TaxID=2315210 RepID=A0A2R5GEL7_9STRA|nr:Sterol 3-beta-glucosyltransferase [Hondaea fermentalgiana]|eukprot:GBG26264.1 Sterol 3-beta-glucosyltransferase [Hondaea fermentalgiana]
MEARGARARRGAVEPLKYVLRLSGFETLKDEGYTVYFVRVAVESSEAALRDGGQRLCFAREGIYLPEADFEESDAPDSDPDESGVMVKACSSFMPGIYKWYAGQPAPDPSLDMAADRRAVRADTEDMRDPHRLYIGDQVHLGASAPRSGATTPTAGAQSLLPRLRFVIIVVGSRGDVQPYVALGMALRRQGHYVRIAAHECFRGFVGDANLGFAPLAGDPKELLRMVTENSMFSYSFVREGVASHRTWISHILDDAWDACTLPEHELRDGPEKGPRPEREPVRPSVGEGPGVAFAARESSFRADVVMANPPAFSGWHIAEALGVPFFTSFPMPWSRTTEFPSPFTSTRGESSSGRLNWMSYGAVDRLMWLGAGDLINRWRVQTLRLAPIWTMSARGHRLAHDNRTPVLYPWSPQMLPKPKDWGSHICIPGYWFLDDEMAKESVPAVYEPPAELRDFLAQSQDPPIFIGFGSIVVKDPRKLSTIIADTLRAMSKAHRFIVQAGWADVNVGDLLGALQGEQRVLQIGAAPHRWLFERCKCVIHHGGAGTTAEGLRAGKPTVVVPFFGDQFFWARQVDAVRVGVRLPYTQLTAKRLCVAIEKALGAGMRMRAQVLAASIARENGTETAIAFIEQRLLRMEGVRGMEIIVRHPGEQAREDRVARSQALNKVAGGFGEELATIAQDEDTKWTQRYIEESDFWRFWPYVEMTDKAAERKTPAPLRAINSIGRQIKVAGSAIRGTVGTRNKMSLQPPGVELQERPKMAEDQIKEASPFENSASEKGRSPTLLKRRMPSTSFASRIPPGHTHYSWRRGPTTMLGHTAYSAGAEFI